MTGTALTVPTPAEVRQWLHSYYLLRAAVSGLWVAAAFMFGTSHVAVGAVLLIVYPAWDAVANVIDAQNNGGLTRNPIQAVNAIVSGVTTAGVAVAFGFGMHAVIGVFGVWATLAGLLQLAVGVRRWKTYGAQWAMVLSGAQSALVGAVFLKQAFGGAAPSIADIAPYAAFGAFYFLVSALWLTASEARRRRMSSATA
ncbi:DUF308 domain-containing protein [Mycolicibacterium baixiangningiae]|uniref:DUF308 domain-containing protein n=1 Tax=Mycolicibacterium baixiangningiae TaxID=2761578 RepID=UPI0018D197CF|nr:DUF308 domain-containing protein [Mycolicibacterium baixiangningiae]